MTTYPERQKISMWINETVNAGATKQKACKAVGISIRTLQRWVEDGKVYADQRPITNRPEPVNKLSKEEIDKIKLVCTSPEFADMPPF